MEAEWKLIRPHLPRPSRRGCKRRWPLREIVNAIFYILRTGCRWRRA
jgi:transposase